MSKAELKIAYIGGPTALIQFGGLRFVTDPTFDAAPAEYPSGLKKTQSPTVAASALGRVDAVLLSHDHHSDNLDNAGRTFLGSAGRVITTQAGAERLKGNALVWSRGNQLKCLQGMEQSVSLPRQLGMDRRTWIVVR
jgi:L-ascorbate metabolism protein UlaG (beta-lactamase superfamily)